ncbi:hypothetical protein [Phytohabitans aurantiacus]|uniref:SH3b domain-containing protein n=1 Tax=Phytohabitans aurantiacus TaxID=3016789 RepID=A0ABQ5R4D1_9ACTN|nr:hypothetical protein [Phytohabitans aurantiacus]GLI01042.1 hypothetical protein Pa4123_63180 [Phytohabitans aurantiacus]
MLDRFLFTVSPRRRSIGVPGYPRNVLTGSVARSSSTESPNTPSRHRPALARRRGIPTPRTTMEVTLRVDDVDVDAPSVDSLPDETNVTVLSQTSGTTVTGTYGTSAIWDRIGPSRYVADGYLHTGYDGYIPGLPRG